MNTMHEQTSYMKGFQITRDGRMSFYKYAKDAYEVFKECVDSSMYKRVELGHKGSMIVYWEQPST